MAGARIRREFVEAVVRVRTHPDWSGLIDAITDMQRQYADACVIAPLDTVQNAQGRAQAIGDLIELLTAPTDKLKAQYGRRSD